MRSNTLLQKKIPIFQLDFSKDLQEDKLCIGRFSWIL